MNESVKSAIVTTLKIAAGVVILYLLMKSGKLDFSKAGAIFNNPKTLVVTISGLMTSLFLTTYRWKKILELKTKKDLPLKTLMGVQWIGNYFSTVLPGAVTGDMVKLGYIKKLDSSISKKYLFFSVFLDRIVGLVALLMISGITSGLFYNELVELSPKFKNIIFINGLLFLGSLAILAFIFLPNSLRSIVKKMLKIKILVELLEDIWKTSENKITYLKLIGLSTLSHLISFYLFYIVNESFFQTNINFRHLLTVIPLGQVAVAIPISPAGLGVGHLAYQNLFQFLHQTNGATLFNNFWILTIIFFALGIIPYLIMSLKKNHAK